MTTQNLLIRLAVDGAAQVRGALGGVQSGLGDLGGAASRVSASLQTVGGAFAALGVGLSVGALTGWVKGAIDAADEIGKLAQKTGLAAEQVAGLQLAFAGGGVADKFQETLGKLAVEAANGNKAFAAMGLAVTNSTGGLKSTRDLLAEVADKFSSYRDGAEKTVLVQKLFGESGADLIVLLNGGSESLAEFDKRAAALGLTLSTETTDAAGEFNDTLDLASQTLSGVASKVAAQLLPTLNTLAGELMGAVTNSGLLIGVTNGLAFAFKGLYSVGVGVVETFRTLGTYLGGVGAAIGALVRGEFGQINGIIADMRRDISANWEAAGASIRRAWDGVEDPALAAMAKMQGAARKAAEEARKAAEEAKKNAPLVNALTNARTGHKKAIDAEAAALKALTQALDTEAKFRQIIINDELKQEKLRSDRMDSTREMLESIERETALMGLSNTEREQSVALFSLEKAGVIAGTEAYDAYAAKIREAISARGNKQGALDAIKAETEATAKAAADAATEWQKTADSINTSLTDALMRGFEDGKGFAKNLRDTLVNMFKTMILRPTISAILAPIAGGLSGAANAGGGGGGGFSNIASLASNASSMVTIGGQVAAGTMSIANALGTLTANATGTGISGLLATNGAFGTAAAGTATGAGITAALASIGPVGWAAIAVAALGLGGAFSRKLKDSGVEGSFGGERGFEGENFQFFKGGMFRSDKTKTNPLAEEVRRTLADSFSAIQAQTGTFAESLGLNTKAIETYSRKIKFSTKGLSETQIIEKLQEELGLVSDEMARLVLGTSAYTKQNETSTATLARLSLSLIVANESFKVLGLGLYSATLAAGDMASDLADKFGGMDALTQASAAYFTTYYSAAEQAAKQSELMAAELARVGLALPSTRSEFRALVSGLDLTTESGRTAYAALLKIAPQFDETARAMEELARVAAEKLIKAFTGSASVVSALNSSALSAAVLRENLLGTSGATSTLAARFGLTTDSTGKLTSSLSATQVQAIALATGLTNAQVKTMALTGGASTLTQMLSGTSGATSTLAARFGLTSASVATLTGAATSFGTGADAAKKAAEFAVIQISGLAVATGRADLAAAGFSGKLGSISTELGKADSGVLYFGDRIVKVTTALTPAQLAVAGLQDEVLALRTAASGTVVNIAGLSVALRDVNTETFVATVTGVFELIGQRVKSTLAGIADERAAVREAAVRIIGPASMSPAQIRSQIAASSVGLPGQQGIAGAQQRLAQADALVSQRQALKSSADSALASAQSASTRGVDAAKNSLLSMFNSSADIRRLTGGNSGLLLNGSIAPGTTVDSKFGAYGGSEAITADLARRLTALQTAQTSGAAKIAAAQATATTRATALSAAQTASAAAASVAQKAQLDYIKALQTYSLSASRAVTQLGRLREETVKYFESQQQLASLMTGTASALRSTVAAFRFEQLDPAAQLASLQERYNVVYSMALSTTGDALAGYGDELNSLINPLLQKAEEAGIGGVAYSNLVNTILARAEATAGRLETFAPKNFQAESLGLLGQIDSTLISLEQGALTADQLIVKAIDAGKDTTRDGLRAVIAALTGRAVPAFAAGGMHTGGLRLVGEYGPELEATGPSRIYSAGDTSRMLSGGGQDNKALLAELQALRAEVAAQRRDTQTLQTQIVVNTGKTARLLDRFDGEGLPVRNVEGQTLTTKAV